MKIFYDVTRLLHRSKANTPTGIDRVDINYAYYFMNNESYEVVCIYQEKSIFHCLSNSESFVAALYSKWILGEAGRFDFDRFFKKSINKEKVISKCLADARKELSEHDDIDYLDGSVIDALYNCNEGVYINTSHHGVGHDRAYHAFRILGGLKISFYLHDIIPIDFPEYVREGDEVNHAKRVKAMAFHSDVVLVNSNYTKDRFVNFCSDNGIRQPHVEVLYIGVEQNFIDVASRFSEEKFFNEDFDYFVYISTIEPRKNHLMLLALWRKMIMSGDKKIPKLVLIGKRGWNNQSILDLLDRSEFLKGHVVELSGLTDKQMCSILANSKALLYPSFVEGWGMPLVEAIAARVPVVCSDIPAHKESGQMLLKYIDPINALEWEKAINNLLDINYYNDCIKPYSEYVFPSWDSHFYKLDEVIGNINECAEPNLSLKKETAFEQFASKSVSAPLPKEEGFGFIEKTAFSVFFDSPKKERTRRLVRKFKNDPVKYLLDSRNGVLRKVGQILQSYE